MFTKEANFVHKICNICRRQPFRTKQAAGDFVSGGLLKKVSQSSRPASRESIEIRFLRRRVRRKKHFARRECIFARKARKNARFGAKPLYIKRPSVF